MKVLVGVTNKQAEKINSILHGELGIEQASAYELNLAAYQLKQCHLAKRGWEALENDETKIRRCLDFVESEVKPNIKFRMKLSMQCIATANNAIREFPTIESKENALLIGLLVAAGEIEF